MSNPTLDAVRLYLTFLAGPDRRAEVQTMAGWMDAEKWNPYGIESRERSYVLFSFDPEAMRIRETPAEYLRHLVPHDQTVSGLWPVRFIERSTHAS